MTLRLVPLLGLCATALLALKLLSFFVDPQQSAMTISGAVAQEADETVSGEEVEIPPPLEGEVEVPPALGALPDSLEIGGSAAERAVLESLGKRRENLNEQEGQLDLREKLLRATEERIEKKMSELKKLGESIDTKVREQQEQEDQEVANLVAMYENMKPKDAARIFDRLRMPVLLKVVRRMNPRKMSGVLAKMDPERAEDLTVAIAGVDEDVGDPQMAQTPAQSDLPKIQSN